MSVSILNPIEVRRAIWKILGKPMPERIPPGLIGAGIGILNDAVTQIGDRLIQDVKGAYGKQKIDLTADNRHTVLGFLLTPDDQPYADGFFHDLNDHQKYAIYRWIKPAKPADAWLPREGFLTEARWILSEALQIKSIYKLARWGTEGVAPPISEYLEGLTIKLTDNDSFCTIGDNGMVAEGLKHGGQITMILEDDNITGQPLCDWCNDCPSERGVPCPSCEKLGAHPENNPKKPVWPKPKKAELTQSQRARVLGGLEYTLQRINKIRSEAVFQDTNAVRLLAAFEHIQACGIDQIDPDQSQVDQFLFYVDQYQRAEALCQPR